MDVINIAEIRQRAGEQAKELVQLLPADFTQLEANVFVNACLVACRYVKQAIEFSGAGPIYLLSEVESQFEKGTEN